MVEEVLNTSYRKDFLANPASKTRVARMAAAFSATSQTERCTNTYESDVDKPEKNIACKRSDSKKPLNHGKIIVSPLSEKKLTKHDSSSETDSDVNNVSFTDASVQEIESPSNSRSADYVEEIINMDNASMQKLPSQNLKI